MAKDDRKLSKEDSKVLAQVFPKWRYFVYGSGDSCEGDDIITHSFNLPDFSFSEDMLDKTKDGLFEESGTLVGMDRSWYNDEGGEISVDVDNGKGVVIVSGTEYFTDNEACDDINLTISNDNDENEVLEKLKEKDIKEIILSFDCYDGQCEFFIFSVNGKALVDQRKLINNNPIMAGINLSEDTLSSLLENESDTFGGDDYQSGDVTLTYDGNELKILCDYSRNVQESETTTLKINLFDNDECRLYKDFLDHVFSLNDEVVVALQNKELKDTIKTCGENIDSCPSIKI